MSAEEVRFLTADCGVVDQCGLAYRPRVQPTGARRAISAAGVSNGRISE